MKFETNQPKSATQAARLIRTAERAAKMLSEGYEFEVSCDLVLVNKPGRLAHTYQIDTLTGKCDCPDFVNHGDYCKHTLCYREMLMEKEMWEAICAEEEARAEREL